VCLVLALPQTGWGQKKAVPDTTTSKATIVLVPYDKEGPPAIPGALGKIVYDRQSKGVLKASLIVYGLLPNKSYRLKLNDKPDRDGEGLLPETLEHPDGRKETFLNADPFKTDGHGKGTHDYEITLVPGRKDYKVFVINGDDYKPVLYNDRMVFEVLPGKKALGARRTATLQVYVKDGEPVAPKASGKLIYAPKSRGVFEGAIELAGLPPSSSFVLTFNDKPGRDGSGTLPQKFERSDGKIETYYDFKHVRSDTQGKVAADIRVPLSAGKKDFKLFVKSLRHNYKVALFHDEIRFEVTE
jgi:hypothetical protein